MAIKVTRPSDEIEGSVVTVFLYGPSGSLKTRSACSFPMPLVCNFEDGLKSVRDLKDVQEIAIGTWTDMVEVSVSLTELRKQTGFKTLVIDSGTISYDKCVHSVAKAAGNAYPTLPNYGVAADKIKENLHICRDWCRANKAHLVMTAIDQTLKDDTTGLTRGAPDMGRKCGDEVALFFDIYGHMDSTYDAVAKKLARTMWTVKRDIFPAKDRLGVLEPNENLSGGETLWQVLKRKAPFLME